MSDLQKGGLISKSANGDHDSRAQGQVVSSFGLLNKRLEATAFQENLSPGMLCWAASSNAYRCKQANAKI